MQDLLRTAAVGVCITLVMTSVKADESPGPQFVARYCIGCHGPKKQEVDLRLDGLQKLGKPQLQRRWHDIYRKVADREMPPEDARQPDQATRAKLLKWIEKTHGAPHDPRDDHWAFQAVKRPVPPKHGKPMSGIDAFVVEQLRRHKLQLSPQADRRTLIRRLTLDLTGLPPTPEEVRAFVEDRRPFEKAYAAVVDRLLKSPRYGERWAQHWLDVIRWAETVGFETNFERPNAWHYRDWVIRSLNEDKPYDRFVFEQIAGDTTGHDAALGFLVAGPANLPGQIGRDVEAMRQARQDELDEVIRTVSQSLFGLTIGCARCHDHKFDPILQTDYYALQAVFAGLRYGDRRLRGKQNDGWTAQVPAARQKLAELQQELRRREKEFSLRPPLQSVQTETFEPVHANAVRMEIDATASGAASLYELEVWSVGTDQNPARNVALASGGAKPSASSFALANQTRHFDNLVDGTVDKRQAFPWVSAKSGPAWVQIDLSATETIDHVRWHRGSSLPASYRILVRKPGSDEWVTVAHTTDRLPQVGDMRAATHVKLKGMSAAEVDSLFKLLEEIRAAQSELGRLSSGPRVYAASFVDPDTTWLLKRGDPMQRGGKVLPAVPAFLKRNSDSEPKSESDRRLALARHLTSADHPLTARVIVNRVWQHHLGRGLVETPSDFGNMGSAPTHPKLLDWLASEFTANGWSLKYLHRLIVTSTTYQQSGLPNEKAIAIDAESRLLWRYPPRRLEAEAIRDSILSVSGKLNLHMYGRGFDFFDRRGGLSDYTAKEKFNDDGYRRMVYAHRIRMQAIDIFGAFDCPDAGQMTPRRNQSITPLQSLGLFNSPFVTRQAGFFADRVLRESPDAREEQVVRAFEIALSRSPSPAESRYMTALAQKHGLKQVCRVLLNSSEFVFVR